MNTVNNRQSHAFLAAIARMLVCFGLLAASGCAFAQGGPPLVTDDPDTPGDGKWEVNLASIGSKTYHHWEVDALDADINYGLGENVQLKLELPWTYAKDSGESWNSGLGAVDLGVKWRFIDKDENHGFAMSTYPQFLTSPSNYSKRNGIATVNKEFFLPLELATEAGGVDFTMEAGRNFVEHEPDAWEAGIVAAHECGSEKLECLVEVHQTWVSHNSQTLLNFGVHYKIDEQLIFLAAAGREFGAHSDDQQRFLYYVGFQILR